VLALPVTAPQALAGEPPARVVGHEAAADVDTRALDTGPLAREAQVPSPREAQVPSPREAGRGLG